jgi:formyltetrahydrofolate synthetase
MHALVENQLAEACGSLSETVRTTRSFESLKHALREFAKQVVSLVNQKYQDVRLTYLKHLIRHTSAKRLIVDSVYREEFLEIMESMKCL